MVSAGWMGVGLAGGGAVGMESYLMGIEFQFCRTVLEMGQTTMWMYLALLNCMFKTGLDGKFHVMYIL